jgi:hypothetical protein
LIKIAFLADRDCTVQAVITNILATVKDAEQRITGCRSRLPAVRAPTDSLSAQPRDKAFQIERQDDSSTLLTLLVRAHL